MRKVLLIVGLAIGLSVLSVVLDPSTAAYDPWSWIGWGREIVHGHLDTRGGPAWKPLPVIFTTAFAPLGHIAPDAWIVAARTSCLLCLAAAFALGRRLAGPGAVGIVAGIGAAVGLVLVAGATRTAIMATSEGLLVFGTLMAADRQLAGRPREAFAWATFACLVRPEPWPLLALYALWLVRRGDLRLPVAAATGAGILAIWFLPELWGSGDLLRSSHRATAADITSYARQPSPWLAALRDVGGLPPLAAIAGLVPGLLAFRTPGARDFRILLGLTLGWAALVVVAIAGGYAGSPRYLFGVAGLLTVLGAAGWGLGYRALAGATGSRRLLRPAPVLVAGAASALLAFTLTARLPAIGHGEEAADRAAAERNALPELIEASGGLHALDRCGPVATSSLQVPLVAWYLDVPMRAVERTMATSSIDFQLRSRSTSPWTPIDGHHVLASEGRWRLLRSSCGPQDETQGHPAEAAG